MSSDTTKENVSVVDSSLTEWKNDTGYLDGPGNAIVFTAHVFLMQIFAGFFLLSFLYSCMCFH